MTSGVREAEQQHGTVLHTATRDSWRAFHYRVITIEQYDARDIWTTGVGVWACAMYWCYLVVGGRPRGPAPAGGAGRALQGGAAERGGQPVEEGRGGRGRRAARGWLGVRAAHRLQ